MAMDRLLLALAQPALAAAKLLDEMISASSIESAASACGEIDRKNALKRALAEIERPRLTSSGAA
jgi:hypothetical protein